MERQILEKGFLMKELFRFFGFLAMIGFFIVGALTTIFLLRIVVGVIGAMLGSAIGTVVLAWILWRIYKKGIKKGWF